MAKEAKEAFIGLGDIRCPVCGNPINWFKVIGDYEYKRSVSLLAECWSGSLERDEEKHLFVVVLNKLPVVEAGPGKTR